MISPLNFKPYNKGSIIGFMDVQIGLVTIKGARLMAGKDNSQMWIALPQMPGTDDDGGKKYHEIIHVTSPVREHIRKAVIAELELQGHISPGDPAPSTSSKPKPRPGKSQFRGQEDLGEYYSKPGDDIPF
jgi:DNA-binding cell septation regulator SpoVG